MEHSVHRAAFAVWNYTSAWCSETEYKGRNFANFDSNNFDSVHSYFSAIKILWFSCVSQTTLVAEESNDNCKIGACRSRFKSFRHRSLLCAGSNRWAIQIMACLASVKFVHKRWPGVWIFYEVYTESTQKKIHVMTSPFSMKSKIWLYCIYPWSKLFLSGSPPSDALPTPIPWPKKRLPPRMGLEVAGLWRIGRRRLKYNTESAGTVSNRA